MAVLLLWSSPNMDGLTAAAKERLAAGLRKGGAEVQEVHLNRQKIEHCRACGNGWGLCRAQGACVLQDDFADLYEKLVQADGIVWVTAVYWHDLTECMKAFVDRLRRCETGHNGYLRGKTCLLAACAGGTGLGAVECLHNLEEAIRQMGMRACDRLPVIRFNRDYMLPALEAAGELYAKRLLDGQLEM